MIRFRRSIFSRLLWLHVLALCAAAIAMPVAIYLILSMNADVLLVERRLFGRSDILARALAIDTRGEWRMNLDPATRAIYERGISGLAFAIKGNDGEMLFATPEKVNDALATAPREEGTSYFEVEDGPAIYYGISRPYRYRDQTVWIVITQNLDSPDIIFDDVVAGALKRAAAIGLLLFAFLFLIDLIIFRRALAPVVAASNTAARIDPGRFETRLPTDDLPLEVMPLATAMNAALDRLEAGYRLQREFSSDVAHELRTPLSILRMHAENLDSSEAAQSIRQSIGQMTRTIEQLLYMAEVESGRSFKSKNVDLVELAEQVIGDLAAMAIAKGQILSLNAARPTIAFMGHPELLGLAIRNLVENAILHTATATQIEIAVEAGPVVTVSDDGTGIAREDQPHIFGRFWRAEKDQGKGAGLGLSIVAKIAAMHHGRAYMRSRRNRGSKFVLDLRPDVEPGRLSGQEDQSVTTTAT